MRVGAICGCILLIFLTWIGPPVKKFGSSSGENTTGIRIELFTKVSEARKHNIKEVTHNRKVLSDLAKSVIFWTWKSGYSPFFATCFLRCSVTVAVCALLITYFNDWESVNVKQWKKFFIYCTVSNLCYSFADTLEIFSYQFAKSNHLDVKNISSFDQQKLLLTLFVTRIGIRKVAFKEYLIGIQVFILSLLSKLDNFSFNFDSINNNSGAGNLILFINSFAYSALSAVGGMVHVMFLKRFSGTIWSSIFVTEVNHVVVCLVLGILNDIPIYPYENAVTLMLDGFKAPQMLLYALQSFSMFAFSLIARDLGLISKSCVKVVGLAMIFFLPLTSTGSIPAPLYTQFIYSGLLVTVVSYSLYKKRHTSLDSLAKKFFPKKILIK